MRQNKQNQIIYFFPDPQMGGVEKNFFLISKYLSSYFKENFLITNNKIYNKIDKRIKLITINKLWSCISRRTLFIVCSFKLFLFCLKKKIQLFFHFKEIFMR